MKINAYRIKLAQQFLNKLKKELKKVKCEEALTLEMYANGREHGYNLSVWLLGEKGRANRWSCSFSENRNSDQLVVYTGLGFTAFSMQGNVPLEEAYSTKKLFSADPVGLEAAVDFVVSSLSAFLLGKEATDNFPKGFLEAAKRFVDQPVTAGLDGPKVGEVTQVKVVGKYVVATWKVRS